MVSLLNKIGFTQLLCWVVVPALELLPSIKLKGGELMKKESTMEIIKNFNKGFTTLKKLGQQKQAEQKREESK